MPHELLPRLGILGQSALNRMSDVFGTALYGPPGVEGRIRPVINIEPWIAEYVYANQGSVDPGGATVYTVATVPNGELWRVHYIEARRKTASSLTLDMARIGGPTGGRIIVAEQTPAILIQWMGETGLWAPAGATIQVQTSAYSASDTMDLYWAYTRFRSVTPAVANA